MSASATAATTKPAPSLNAKDKAVWYAVSTLDIVSYLAIAVLAYFIGPRLGSGAVGTGLVFCICTTAFGLTRYGLWCLTRPYASAAATVHPATNRALLCNFDFKFIFFALAGQPPTELLVEKVRWAVVVILAWVALMGPLEAANARDAARNTEIST